MARAGGPAGERSLGLAARPRRPRRPSLYPEASWLRSAGSGVSAAGSRPDTGRRDHVLSGREELARAPPFVRVARRPSHPSESRVRVILPSRQAIPTAGGSRHCKAILLQSTAGRRPAAAPRTAGMQQGLGAARACGPARIRHRIRAAQAGNGRPCRTGSLRQTRVRSCRALTPVHRLRRCSPQQGPITPPPAWVPRVARALGRAHPLAMERDALRGPGKLRNHRATTDHWRHP